MADDPREAAARYRLQKQNGAAGEEPGAPASAPASRGFSELERAAYVETAIQQAVRRGEFDDLPGAGKPLPGLGTSHDPDWWIRRKIETEGLTGLGPPALLLRSEHAELDRTLDDLRTERDVREHLDDFNRRVVEARRQLLGGPPVITPTVDVDVRIHEWRERRDAAAHAAPDAPTRESTPVARRRRWLRRSPADRGDNPEPPRLTTAPPG